MDSDQGSSNSSKRIRFDQPDITKEPKFLSSPGYQASQNTSPAQPIPRLIETIRKTSQYLISTQHEDGYWVGELEGDTILESEYILLQAFLGKEKHSDSIEAAEYILENQLPSGGWSLYPDGPLDISASVKSYLALKLTGHSPEEDYMLHAKRAILEAGGVEKVNSFTRFYLALLGVIDYWKCPAVPPELILIPRWMPLNIYEMSSWSRTIVIPLSIMWANRPTNPISEEYQIPELFQTSPEKLSPQLDESGRLDKLKKNRFLNWHKIFNRIDATIKFFEKLRIRPFRRLALKKASNWMLARFENSDGLGAIFPPIIWSVIALKTLGYDDDSEEVKKACNELEKLMIRDRGTIRIQPCKSPVWDTAIATLALHDAGVPTSHSSINKSIKWLLSKEVRKKGDWAKLNPGHEPSGWFFEFENEHYPDVDDTSMVLMSLCRCLPEGSDWSADFLLGNWSPHENDKDTAAVIATKSGSVQDAFRQVETIQPQLLAIWRGLRWILAMQNKDGGWGAFDKNNNREIFTKVPFADHNAMIDPSTADLSARNLELFADLNLAYEHPAVQQALEFVWDKQESDGSWYGRWGVNYLYGTWQALVGLSRIGIPSNHPRIRLAVNWLKSIQQRNGGWGETPESYDNPQLKGTGPVTASQTAWALLGLIAAGEVNSPEVIKGMEFLIDTQSADGTWEEPYFTGTGFPKVFYLKYHLYSVYFPLMALSRYQQKVR